MAPTGALSTLLQTLNQMCPNVLALSSPLALPVQSSLQEVETLRELKVKSTDMVIMEVHQGQKGQSSMMIVTFFYQSQYHGIERGH